MTDITKWEGSPFVALSGLLEQNDRTKVNPGERWLYRHKCRCPACHAYWVWECAVPRGEVDPNPDPVRIGMGLLCGRCEAQRRAYRGFGEGLALRIVGLWWGEEETRKAWGMLRHHSRDYRPTVERVGVYDGSPLRDDRNAELERIFGPGQRAIIVTEPTAYAMGLQWPLVEHPKKAA